MTSTSSAIGAQMPPSPKPVNLGVALALISMTQLLIVLDGTIANIALPRIGQDLGMSSASLTWIITGYALIFGSFLLVGGRLGDRYGHRRIFAIGLLALSAGSLVAGLATTPALLLVARAIQALGAALAAPTALALITTTFPAGPERGRAFGVYAAMSGAGSGVGLLLGGWLTSIDSIFGVGATGWRLTFLLNVPIGLAVAALVRRHLRESDTQPGRLDLPGVATSTIGLIALVYGFTLAGASDHGWTDVWTVASLVLGVLLLVLFLVIEARSQQPLLPLRVFRDRDRGTSFIALMLALASMFTMFYFLTLFVQRLLDYSSLQAGLAFLPLSLGIIVGATVTPRLLLRVDPRVVAGTGTLLAAISLFMFSRIQVDGTAQAVLDAIADGVPVAQNVSYWTDLFPYITALAVGMGMTFASLTPTAVHRVKSEDAGVASGMLNTVQQIGGAVGLAVLGSIAVHYSNVRAAAVQGPITAGLADDPNAMEEAIYQASFTPGATRAFLVASAVMLVASLLIWLRLRVRSTELAAGGNG
ncbi:MFS transporter [Micromonospora chokoriensis]